MSYKLLLAGKNNMIKDDFFEHLDTEFEMLTTSLRYHDMVNHLKMYTPDLFVYCIYDDTKDEYSKLVEYKRQLTKQDVNVAIVGNEQECEAFQMQTNNMADLILVKPLTTSRIHSEIVDFMRQLEEMREESRRLQEELAKKAEEERRKHVMIIDDDPRQMNVIKEYLHEKYDVATAISGKIAYRFLEKKQTDLILLDFEMPEENGPEVLRKLREMNLIENVPVLFLTGATEKEKIHQALALRPQGYLLKPIDKEKLLGNIEKFIG